MSECTHSCSTCGESCGERQEPQSLLKELNPESRVGKVYGIVSGKGGVGKSMPRKVRKKCMRSPIAIIANSCQCLNCSQYSRNA